MIDHMLAQMHEVARYVRSERITCPACNGAKVILIPRLVTSYSFSPDYDEIPCGTCRGKGTIDADDEILFEEGDDECD